MSFLRKLLPWAWLIVLLALTFTVRCWNWDQVFLDGQTYFVDADCYSRMTRVKQVMAEPWKPIRTHDFENAPIGTQPHTTAPMDLTIAALAVVIRSLDLAGALVSPLLGVALVAFLWWWGRRLQLPFRNALLALAIFSPILAHGFLLGRPDHQSLILLLTGAALAAELAIWTHPARLWHLLSAVCWALALWTSLFEPLILLIAALLGRLVVHGRQTWQIRDLLPPTLFAVILAAGFLFDGWRSPPTAPEIAEFFPRWSQTIGELNHVQPVHLVIWTGWLLPVVPILLILRFFKEKSRPCLALAFLVLLTVGLTLWYGRWGYFLALVFALSLPFALASIPARPVVWILFIISLWPIAAEWERQLYPDAKRQAALIENREDAILLRETALAMASPDRRIFLAPWWLSPAFVYWSGQPGVAGSSHQSLPGIADTARFYVGSTEAGQDILRRRAVHYVVIYEPSRVLQNSGAILNATPTTWSLGHKLWSPGAETSFLRLAYENKYFKLYEVRN